MKRILCNPFPLHVDLLPREGEAAAAAGAAAGEGDQAAAAAAAEKAPGVAGGLLTGKTAEGKPAEVKGDEFTIPEKFLVNGEDGKPNWEAIARKAIPSYGNLEKRFGSGDAPPETPDKYKIENYLPEGYERNPEGEKKVLASLHSVGLNNKQAQGVLALYGSLLGEGLAAEKASMEKASAELKTEWGADYDKRMSRSNFALSQAPETLTKAITTKPHLMNDPDVIRLLDFVGEQFEDDKSANEMGAGEIEDVDQLRRSPAYMDEKHADHGRVVAKVNAAYARGYKDKTGG